MVGTDEDLAVLVNILEEWGEVRVNERQMQVVPTQLFPSQDQTHAGLAAPQET